MTDAHDPFARCQFPVGVRTIQALDEARNRVFPCEIWYPAAEQHAGQDLAAETQDRFTTSGGATRIQAAVRAAAARPGRHPLVLFSHASGQDRRASTFLCTHLASHGYLVGAADHSEVVAPELARRDGETPAERAARVEGWIAGRVPDVRFLLEHLLSGAEWPDDSHPDPARIGIAGHSFGGWTALAATRVEPRIGAVVALAPGGSSRRRPGIIPAELSFAWERDVPTLYLVAEKDVSLPLEGMR